MTPFPMACFRFAYWSIYYMKNEQSGKTKLPVKYPKIHINIPEFRDALIEMMEYLSPKSKSIIF